MMSQRYFGSLTTILLATDPIRSWFLISTATDIKLPLSCNVSVMAVMLPSLLLYLLKALVICNSDCLPHNPSSDKGIVLESFQ